MTEQEIALEKLRIKRNREKFWVGTVLLGIVSLVINSSVQNSKLEHERIKQDNEHLSKFVSYAISKDLEVRRDIAEYFNMMSYTKETQDRWEKYLNSINTLIDLKYSLIANIQETKYSRDIIYLQISEAKLSSLSDPDNEALRNKISELYRELDGKQSILIEKTQELQKVEISQQSLPVQVKPSWYSIAENELNKGVVEIAGEQHNPDILKYFSETGYENIKDDEMGWNSAFLNWCFSQVEIEGTGKLNSRSWLEWGTPIESPKIGCVVVFWRQKKDSWSGHAGFYAGGDGDKILLLGGNQKNSVSILSVSKEKILGYRWPKQ